MARKSNGGSRINVSPCKVTMDGQGRIEIHDLATAMVVVMFFIQKLGKVDLTQLADKVIKAGVVIDPNLLEQSVEGLQAREYVSVGKGYTVQNEVVNQWSPRRANFAGIPEHAQISQSFLSDLVASEDAVELLGVLNEAEAEGDGQAKARSQLKYRQYYACNVRFVTTSNDDGGSGVLLGGRPSSPMFDHLIKIGPACPKECDLRFARNSAGQPVIPLSNVAGWLGNLLRFKNFSPTMVQYISIRGGLIEFEGSIMQHSQQVVDLSGGARGGGRGITTYEAIAAGAHIEFYFVVPEIGGMPYNDFVNFLIDEAPNSKRGLSNARSNEYGWVEVVDAKFLGYIKDGDHVGRGGCFTHLSEEGRAFAEKFRANRKKAA